MDTKFTDGPWQMLDSTGLNGKWSVHGKWKNGCGFHIASSGANWPDNPETSRANGKLIEQSPRLFFFTYLLWEVYQTGEVNVSDEQWQEINKIVLSLTQGEIK
jgi:hypothetical protein